MQNNSFYTNLISGVSQRLSKIFNNPYRNLNLSIPKIKYIKHLPTGKQRKHKMLGGTINYYSPQELLHGLNEIFVEEVYNLLLSDSPLIIDCGANIGLSIIYLKKKFPAAKIIAFEPDEKNFELLTKNINSFHFNNVELKKEAVWNDNTTLSFQSEGSMSSKIELQSRSANQVKAVRLRDYLQQQVNFLKIDIEGAEYTVMKDIADVLHNVDYLFLEYHGRFNQNTELVEILDILQKSGFYFYIKEAASVYDHPFTDAKVNSDKAYDLQLNIFCLRK